ncbi:MAG TPA: Hsp20/alpha crystallin family protein [Ktedonobacterales bacterium]|nr:Hsp20/alpha crystallin family protein [Ktedonobacterales bacterium]
MSSLTRWDPFRDMTSLRDAMDQLMERAVLRPGLSSLGGLAGSSVGLMNVFESGSRYICQVLLPGVTADAIDLTVRQNTLSIKAKLPELVAEETQKDVTYLLREFGAGEFTRAISFPKDVDGDAVQAQLEHGVLTIAIPLAQHAQPRRIQINQMSGDTQKQLNASASTQVVDEQATSDAHSSLGAREG